LESLAPTRVDVDDTDRYRFARVLWAVLALFPWGMNLANEIEAGIVLARQLDRFFAFPDAEVFAGHVLLIPGARVTSEPGIQKQPPGPGFQAKKACGHLLKRIKISLYNWIWPKIGPIFEGSMSAGKLSFDALNAALKAAGEETRLRVLALVA